jgi:hypothetical protein
MAKKLDDLFYTLELKDKEFIQETQKIQDQLKNVQDGMGKDMQKAARDSERGLKGFFQKLQKNWLAIVAVIGSVKKAWDFSKEAAKFNQQVQALEKQFGVSADKILGKLRAVSQGTISDQGLIEATNRAFALNLTQDVDELAKLMEFARLRARALGLDTTQAFTDLTTGLARQSPQILDNLGIMTTSFTKVAEETGRTVDTQFLLEQVLKQANEELGRQGDLVLTDAEKFAVLESKVQNIKVALGQALLEGFRPLIDALININTEGDEFKDTMEAISGIINGISKAIILLSNVIQIIISVFGAFFADLERGMLEIKVNILATVRDIVEAIEKTGIGQRIGIQSGGINTKLNKAVQQYEKARTESLLKQYNYSESIRKNVEEAILNLFKEQETANKGMVDTIKEINEVVGGSGGGAGGKSLKENVSETTSDFSKMVDSVGVLADTLTYANEEVGKFAKEITNILSAISTSNPVGIFAGIMSLLIKIDQKVKESNEDISEQLTMWEEIEGSLETINQALDINNMLIKAYEGNEEAVFRLEKERLEILKEKNKELTESLKTNKHDLEIERHALQTSTLFLKQKLRIGQYDLRPRIKQSVIERIKAEEERLRIIEDQLDAMKRLGEAIELNDNGTIKNLEVFEELIKNETDQDRVKVLEEILKNNQAITSQLEKQKGLNEDINSSALKRIRQEIALGILDPQNIRDIQSIQSRLSAAGLSGLDLGTSLQGLGISGTNLTRSIGSITNIFQGVPTSDLTQQTADQINSNIEGI